MEFTMAMSKELKAARRELRVAERRRENAIAVHAKIGSVTSDFAEYLATSMVQEALRRVVALTPPKGPGTAEAADQG